MNHDQNQSRNPNWKGGRAKTKDGYIRIRLHDHPRAVKGYVLEHVLVAEQALGRILPANAEVHHVNGIPSDNRPHNLVICQDQAYHKLLHRRAAAVLAVGNPLARKCWVCQTWGLDVHVGARGHCYHKPCLAAFEKRRYEEKKSREPHTETN